MAKKKQPEAPEVEATEEVRDDAAPDTSGLEDALAAVEPEASAETAEVAESPEQDSAASLREFLKAQGINVQGETDEEAVAGIAERFNRYEQVEHEREQLRQSLAQYQATLQALQPQLTELQRWQAEQAKPKQAEAPPVDAFLDKLLEGPKLPSDWQQWLDPATKNLREDAPPHIRQAVAEFIDYRDNLPQRVVTGLKENLGAYVRAEAGKLLESQLVPQIESVKAQQATSEFVRANADWLYEKDTSGRPIYDPLTLNGQTSAAGNLFGHFLQQAIADGITSRDRAIDRAMRDLRSHVAVEQAKVAQVADKGEQARRDFTNAAKRTPSRGGSLPRSEHAPTQNAFSPFRDMVSTALKEAGVE